MNIHKLLLLSILILVLKMQSLSQVDKIGLMMQSVKYVDSLFKNCDLVWDGHWGPQPIPCKEVKAQVYDLYSCPCYGKHPIIETASLQTLFTRAGFDDYDFVRLDKKPNEYTNSVTFIFCNKLLKDGCGDYLECNVSYMHEYMVSVSIRMYIKDGIIVCHDVISYDL